MSRYIHSMAMYNNLVVAEPTAWYDYSSLAVEFAACLRKHEIPSVTDISIVLKGLVSILTKGYSLFCVGHFPLVAGTGS